MIVEFIGPFSWLDKNNIPSILTSPEGKRPGIYLWTVNTSDGELIYYVGETGRSFSQRLIEHFREHMSGGYHIHDPQEIVYGKKVQIWPGRFGSTGNRSISEFLENYLSIAPSIVKLTEVYRFFVAPLQCDNRLRARIEAGIARHLYNQEGVIGSFQESGIRYNQRRKDEEPIEVEFVFTATLLGLPKKLWV